ncbi:protein of unknown function [Methylorubrum extorquens DM4]|uniref:Uncharacterized protein n=1 Tax=Methylorubrum extorquens (strain DSM 6343 / CIP 106787 / DM4) TaxID=661410 RepID=C7CCE0_METED|nr:hypothetical protein [Methylorubrum extorquens]CAX22486.1 protein of unknown function [Methylorubrum extorquens DM4]
MLVRDEESGLRDALWQSRAEAMSLRLDLAEAHGFIEALEAELWAAGACWTAPEEARAGREPSPLRLLLQARTLIRQRLFQELVPGCNRAAAMHDLRITEVAFKFLLGRPSLRMRT